MRGAPLTRRRILLGALALTLALSALLFGARGCRRDPEPAPDLTSVPDADLPAEDPTKAGSYRRSGGAAAYWESLGEDMEDSQAQAGEDPPARPRRESPTVDALFGEFAGDETPAAAPATPAPKPSRGGGGGKAKPAPPATPEEDVKEAAEGITPEDVPATAPPPAKRSGAVSSLDEDIASDLGSGFSTLDGEDRWVGAEEGRAWRCMFTRDQKVRSGERVTLRVLEDMVAGGVHIPRNTHLQGVAAITGRLEVKVTSLDLGGRIVPLSLEAHDTDGGRGIYCSDIGQAARDAADRAVSTASSTLGPRLGRVAREAAAAGASLIRSKGGELTVSIPAGYTFYIIDTSQRK